MKHDHLAFKEIAKSLDLSSFSVNMFRKRRRNLVYLKIYYKQNAQNFFKYNIRETFFTVLKILLILFSLLKL